MDPQDMESVGMVFRAFHTAKGISAFLELALLAEFGDHAESTLSRPVHLDVAGQTVIGSNGPKRNLWSR